MLFYDWQLAEQESSAMEREAKLNDNVATLKLELVDVQEQAPSLS